MTPTPPASSSPPSLLHVLYLLLFLSLLLVLLFFRGCIFFSSSFSSSLFSSSSSQLVFTAWVFFSSSSSSSQLVLWVNSKTLRIAQIALLSSPRSTAEIHHWNWVFFFLWLICSLLLLFTLSSCTNLVTIIWHRTNHYIEEKEKRSKSPSSCKQINLRNASIVEKIWGIWETLYNHVLSSLDLPKRKYASSFKRNGSILTHLQREIGAWLIEGMWGRIQRCKTLLLSCWWQSRSKKP